ncbi:hypothetical protein QBC46DRAFT_144754 [Diplogelasinospora grovesii]|uniref:Uncharacterized protein n=1 Tax=Diplogelasinospora grovesii TaxID=303347 RepID=A0AAN6N775_9PEZI|nr:hypothetical protein QBC46DRAFT_144754 [Diplogelasinospora grovesii]
MAAQRPQHGGRQSRFTEQRMEEYTPANSAYEEDLYYDDENEVSHLRIILRGLNSCFHGAACVILVAIMVQFLNQSRGTWHKTMSPQAITLLTLLAIDTALDITSLVRLHKIWPSWALLLRLICGIGYLALFMVYVGMGRVFPYSFTYWSMAPGYAGPVVYLFLWLIGVWNLLHTAIRRHYLGNGVRRYMAAIRDLSRSTPPAAGGNDQAIPRSTGIAANAIRPAPNRIWRRWGWRRGHQPRGDLESNTGRGTTIDRAASPGIMLPERHVENDNKPESLTTTTSSRPKSDDRQPAEAAAPPPTEIRL